SSDLITARPVQSIDFVLQSRTRDDQSFELYMSKDDFLCSAPIDQSDCRPCVIWFAQKLSVEHVDSDRIAAKGSGRAKITAVDRRQRAEPRGDRTNRFQSYRFIHRVNHLQARFRQV